MPKRRRTQAHIDASRRYREKNKAITVYFSNEDELLKKMRSRVNSDSELPNLLKTILLQYFN